MEFIWVQTQIQNQDVENTTVENMLGEHRFEVLRQSVKSKNNLAFFSFHRVATKCKAIVIIKQIIMQLLFCALTGSVRTCELCSRC